jgi:hypothetical protein
MNMLYSCTCLSVYSHVQMLLSFIALRALPTVVSFFYSNPRYCYVTAASSHILRLMTAILASASFPTLILLSPSHPICGLVRPRH